MLMLIYLSVATVFGIQVEVNSRDVDCFFEQVETFHHTVSFSYEIVEGETESVQVELFDPSGRSLYRRIDEEGRYSHPTEAEEGLYKFCISNTIQTIDNVLIGFAFHAEVPYQDVLTHADATKIEHAQKVAELVYELNIDLDTVRDTLGYMKSRTARHEVTAKSTHDRVAWWTFGETVVLIGLATWQIYYLRRTFEVKRFL